MITVQGHKGKKSRASPIELICSHCNYVWKYYGRLDRYGTNCPRCHSWVTIPPNIRKIPKKTSQAAKTGIHAKCTKCGYEWTYAGKHVNRIMSGYTTVIICPTCGAKVKLP